MAQDLVQRIGQEALDRALGKVLHGRHFGHAFGFFGPDAHAVEAQALWFCRKLACTAKTADPCGRCEACKSIERADGVVLLPVQPEAEHRIISVERIRELRKTLALLAGDLPRIVFLSHAEQCAGPAANALLKLLEEPGAHTYFVLTAANRKNVLSTIRSRTAWYAVQAIPEAVAIRSLQAAGYSAELAMQAVHFAPGVAQFAAQLCTVPDALANQQQAERDMRHLFTLPLPARLLRLQQLLGKKAELSVEIPRAQAVLHQLFHFVRQHPSLWSAMPAVGTALLRLRSNAQPRLVLEATFASLPHSV